MKHFTENYLVKPHLTGLFNQNVLQAQDKLQRQFNCIYGYYLVFNVIKQTMYEAFVVFDIEILDSILTD